MNTVPYEASLTSSHFVPRTRLEISGAIHANINGSMKHHDCANHFKVHYTKYRPTYVYYQYVIRYMIIIKITERKDILNFLIQHLFLFHYTMEMDIKIEIFTTKRIS